MYMLRYYAKQMSGQGLQELREAPKDHAWVYGVSINDTELSYVADKYALDQNIVTDVRDRNELPRVEYSGGALYVFLRTPHQLSKGSIKSVPFLSVIKVDSLITLCSKDYFSPEDITSTIPFRLKNNRYALLQLISYVVGSYETYIHQTGKYISDTKSRLRTHEVDNSDFIKFVTVEGDLNEYKTNLSGTLAVLARLHENRHHTFSDADCEMIEDIVLHINQLTVAVDSHMHTITSIRNAYTTIGNNTLNRRMKTLTLLTVLITLPNVFYGMFGMNVALPFSEEPWAYPAITGTTIIIVLIAWLLVRRYKF